MRLLGNIIWFILGGIINSICWFLVGVILCITIIGIPFGRQCFKIARLYLAPFGKDVECDFAKHPVANVIWCLLIGWPLALGGLISGVLLCITIIGIPFGLQAFKIMKICFFPFGGKIVKASKKQ